jgi:hypothetical protein
MNTAIYTGSGLWRVKPYVQLGGGIMRERSAREEGIDVVPLRGTLGRLILASVPWVTSRFPSILVSYNRESLSESDCLVLYTKYLYVLGPAYHVRGSSGKSDLPVGDG